MDRVKIIFVMILWGSVGVFAKYIQISPVLLAFCRAIISLPVLVLLILGSKKAMIYNLKFKDAKPLLLSGLLIGLAWWSLFTAFKYTGIATAILAYNMCPIYVLLLSAKVLQEELKISHMINVVSAIIGLIITVIPSLNRNGTNLTGIAFGIISGLLYSFIVIINRKFSTEIDPVISTFIQMISASCTLLPIVLIENSFNQFLSLDTHNFIMLLILGVLHTGIGFLIYFSSYKALSAISIALLSYLEPVFGIFFGVIILKEPLTIYQLTGGILILGSTIFEKLNSYRSTLSFSALKK